MTRTRLLPPIAVALLSAVIAACGDADAPTAISAPRSSAARRSTIIGTVTSSGNGSIGTQTGTSTTVTVTTGSSSGSGPSSATVSVGPTSRVIMWIGEHKLVLPPGTICDPLRSGYGPSEWDAPCARITRPVTITARASVNQAGRARVDFSPALRFRPNTMGEVVSLFLLDREAASSDGFTILYCADSGACVDDAATDPSVGTLVEPSTGFIFRRLKHFSGYTIGVGRSHDLSEEY